MRERKNRSSEFILINHLHVHWYACFFSGDVWPFHNYVTNIVDFLTCIIILKMPKFVLASSNCAGFEIKWKHYHERDEGDSKQTCTKAKNKRTTFLGWTVGWSSPWIFIQSIWFLMLSRHLWKVVSSALIFSLCFIPFPLSFSLSLSHLFHFKFTTDDAFASIISFNIEHKAEKPTQLSKCSFFYPQNDVWSQNRITVFIA